MVTTLAVRPSHWETDKNAPRTAGWNGASRDCGSGSVARATPFDFTYTGNLVDFTAPATGLYQILAFGAQGGRGVNFEFIGTGGRGAEIGGDFVLTAGEMLQIAVGGSGAAEAPGDVIRT